MSETLERMSVWAREEDMHTRIMSQPTRIEPRFVNTPDDDYHDLLKRQTLKPGFNFHSIDDHEQALAAERAQLQRDIRRFENERHAEQRELRRVRAALTSSREREKRDYAARRVGEALEKQKRTLEAQFASTLNAKVEAAVELRLADERVRWTAELNEADDVALAADEDDDDNEAAAYQAKIAALEARARLFDGDDEPARSEHTQCVVCLTREVRVMYEPCAHINTCIDCAPRIILLRRVHAELPPCPTCKTPIESFRRVYLGN